MGKNLEKADHEGGTTKKKQPTVVQNEIAAKRESKLMDLKLKRKETVDATPRWKDQNRRACRVTECKTRLEQLGVMKYPSKAA